MTKIDYVSMIIGLIVSTFICFGVEFFDFDKKFLTFVMCCIVMAIEFIARFYRIAKSNNEFED